MAMKRRDGGTARQRDRGTAGRRDGVYRCRRPAVRLCLALALGIPVVTTAQQPTGRPWPVDVAHYAKWPGLAATGTMLTLGFLASRDAARVQDSTAAQAANQRARDWILGGEIGLVATGAMFLLDLIHRDNGPPNIPFTPFRVYASEGRLGLSLRL